ncbi:hypothetical protein D4764_06G0001360 [Takifugu flavidus]|uniref:Uncharacterized protein n=1 Tax=Takifugu flavidus TaxID=433684 RepID=A0A5C6MU44_9TELE|nr:hypothetical protein D4764_06G0001360 [Takifugu flavidus]
MLFWVREVPTQNSFNFPLFTPPPHRSSLVTSCAITSVRWGFAKGVCNGFPVHPASKVTSLALGLWPLPWSWCSGWSAEHL